MTQWFDVLSREVSVLLLAAMPVIELKGAIPAGLSVGLSSLHSFVLAYLGSLLPAPFVMLAVRPIFAQLKRTKGFRHLVDHMNAKTAQGSAKVKRYGTWGLLLFVAIPLPGTGVWTGSVIAGLLNMSLRRALPMIALGNLIAGILIMLLSHGVINLLG